MIPLAYREPFEQSLIKAVQSLSIEETRELLADSGIQRLMRKLDIRISIDDRGIGWRDVSKT